MITRASTARQNTKPSSSIWQVASRIFGPRPLRSACRTVGLATICRSSSVRAANSCNIWGANSASARARSAATRSRSITTPQTPSTLRHGHRSCVCGWGTRLEHEDDGSSVRKRPAGESAPVALPARKRRRGDKSRKNSLRYGGESYETENQFVKNESKSSAKRANLRKRLKGLRPAESNCILTRALSAFSLSKLHASWLKGKPNVHGEARISLLSQGDQPTKQDAVFVVSRLCALSLCKWCCVFNKRYQRRRAGWYWNAAGQRVFLQMRILAWPKQIEEATRHNACSHRGP